MEAEANGIEFDYSSLFMKKDIDPHQQQKDEREVQELLEETKVPHEKSIEELNQEFEDMMN